MCLIAFSYQQHPDYPLALIANRDESYHRATQPAEFWQDHPEILAGRDLEALGTWMGISRQGRFAAVTNFREPHAPSGELSRGNLTRDFIASSIAPAAYFQQLRNNAAKFSGFNLLFGDADALYYFSNRDNSIAQFPHTQEPAPLKPGVYGLSNHLLNTPWPKTEFVTQQLAKQLAQPTLDRQALIAIMQHRQQYPDEQLPDTGIAIEIERTLSSPFIVANDYGTRSTSLLLWHKQGTVDFVEQNYQPLGKAGIRKCYSFKLDSKSSSSQ